MPRPLRALLVLALVVALAFGAGLAVAAVSNGATPRHVVVRAVTVREVQRALHVPADGIWGPRTTRAVKRFQRRHGLTPDGVVGPATARALGLHKAAGGGARRRTGRPRPQRHIVVSGVTVRDVQQALHISADGVWGPQTARTVKRFQRRHGLTTDGVIGPATAGALGLLAGADAALRVRLERIAQCESGGDPRAVSASGRYRGKYQFTRATWRSVGGTGDPARASEAEQDRRALILWKRTRGAAWPKCA